MKNNEFKNFLETVKNADKNDPIWYAGFLWIYLTPAQVDRVGRELWGKPYCECYKRGNAGFERESVKTPAGFEIFIGEKQVMENMKEMLNGCTNKKANQILFDFYNHHILTCGEYNKMVDWIETHTDGNGAVLREW